MNPIKFSATINGISVRNLQSLDKGIKLSAELVDDEDIRLKVAQFFLYQPTDQVYTIEVTPEPNQSEM